MQAPENMDEKKDPLACPVCGAQMEIVKTVRDTLVEWSRFRCTCGHSEDRKSDGQPASLKHSLAAIDGFQEFPSSH
jgi:C4-type Zn-finger protein